MNYENYLLTLSKIIPLYYKDVLCLRYLVFELYKLTQTIENRDIIIKFTDFKTIS